MAAVIDGLEAAFQYFGGVPHELLFDQLKSVIVDDHCPTGGRVLENAEFLRFAAHWDFRIRACRPYRARTKGKVERPISYVRRNLLYGREFLGDADLAAQTGHWLEHTANARVHGTTEEIPRVRFERDERTTLGPLAARPYAAVPALAAARATHLSDAAPLRPLVLVERRPLQAYTALVEVGV